MSDVKRYKGMTIGSLSDCVLAEDYDKLKAENESLRKDAERYRRIRLGYLLDGEIYMLDRRGCMYEEEACLLEGEELDSAIDAAISSPENH